MSSILTLVRDSVNQFFCGSPILGNSSNIARISTEKCLFSIVLAACMTIAPGVSAQEAAPLKLGETQLFPAVRIDYVSIDNLYRQATDEVSGTGVVVKPELVWRADRRLLTLDAQYTGGFGMYSEDGLDYDDHFFRLQGVGDISSKQRLATNLSFRKIHEDQGVGQTASVVGQLDELIEISVLSAQAEYTYGAKDARGNLSGGLLLQSVSYTNLEEFIDGDDYSHVRPYAVFSLRLSPDTRLLAEVRFDTLDFDDDSRDRQETSLLAGVGLSTSSKLSGDARIGMVRASFDENSNADTTELIAEVGVDYAPRSFSRFSFSFDRNFETVDQNDTNAGRSVIDDASIVWTHDWSSRYQTQARLSLLDYDRECPFIDDQTVGAGIELNYQVRRWLQLGISGAQASRTVSACDNTADSLKDLDYDRTVVGAHIRATL